MFTLEITHFNGEVTYPCKDYKNLAIQCFDKESARLLKKREHAQQLKSFMLKKDQSIESVSIIRVDK